MKLNFAFSELIFSYNKTLEKITIHDNIHNRTVDVNCRNQKEHHIIMDIQERIFYDFSVTSIDRTSFDTIQQFVRELGK